MGSLKRSAEGERNRGNTVRKGESFILYIFIEMPACLERGVMLHLSSNDALCGDLGSVE